MVINLAKSSTDWLSLHMISSPCPPLANAHFNQDLRLEVTRRAVLVDAGILHGIAAFYVPLWTWMAGGT